MQPVNVEAKYDSNRVTPEPEAIQCHTSCKDTLVCGTAYRKGGAITEDSLPRSHKHLHPRVDTLLHGTHVCREPEIVQELTEDSLARSHRHLRPRCTMPPSLS